jgi:hypothetical protein
MKFIKFLVAVVVALASTSSIAGPITPDAGWYGFCFAGGVGNPATSGCQNEGTGISGNPFTFTLTTAGIVQVTDAFVFGDTFDVYINSAFAFTTGGGTHTGPTTANPDVAFAGGAYDRGLLALTAGNYSVDIFTRATPAGGGGADIVVVTTNAAVPEPGAFSLVALGLVGLGAIRRKLG